VPKDCRGHSKIDYEIDGGLEIAYRFEIERPSVNECRFEV